MQLKHILSSEEDAKNIRKEAQVFATDSKMYQVPIEFELKARDLPIKVHFKKISTSFSIKLTPKSLMNQAAMNYTADLMREGTKNFIIGANQSVNVSFEPGSQVVQFSNHEFGCSYSGNDF